jgi:hypothetical protein
MPPWRSLGASSRQTTLPAQLPCTRTNVAIASSPHYAACRRLVFAVRRDIIMIAALACWSKTGLGRGRLTTSAHTRGETTRLRRSQYALGVQLPHFRLADPEAAKDFGAVLAEFGRDIAHPHPFADLDRCGCAALHPVPGRSHIARDRGGAPAGRRTSARNHRPDRTARRPLRAPRPNRWWPWSPAPCSSHPPVRRGSPCVLDWSQNAGPRTIPGASKPWHNAPRSPRRRHPPIR